MICFGHRSILHKKKSQLASNFKLTRTPTIRRAWSNSSYTILAKPIKMLELHYQMIQFLKIIIRYTQSISTVCIIIIILAGYYVLCLELSESFQYQ